MSNSKIFEAEEQFHDKWAESVDVSLIDVYKTNEALTAPEMRYITQALGNKLKGAKLLDVGCGLGEASVYFALKGAQVTATDISGGMLDATQRLAGKYNTTLTTHKSTAENLLLDPEQFDIVYVGNLFHHVEIEVTILKILAVLKKGGTLVSWDPLAYNPIINVYRRIATNVRTDDEHPLTVKDIALFKKHFNNVETKYFWFFTLIIFILMALVQFRNPNKERFWKKVIEEEQKWAWLYKPLAALDNVTLKIFPFLKYLCWNIVIVAKK